MKLFVDDEPEMKAVSQGIDLEENPDEYDIAYSVDEALEFLSSREYEMMYLDYKIIGGTGSDVLTWLSDHLDRVPKNIISISFMPLDPHFGPKIRALLKMVERKNCESIDA